MPLPSRDYLNMLSSKPLVHILFSGCLGGIQCGFDGSSYGDHQLIQKLANHPKVTPVYFCPEDFSFGTPRALCDIHGGDGFDVLAGRARVLTEDGTDWSEGMIRAAERMLQIAQTENIDLAILMDTSAACGSQVIYEGRRTSENKIYQKGAGVCAALLMQNGIAVMSQRDYKTLEHLFCALDPEHQVDPKALDHHETEWYRGYFK